MAIQRSRRLRKKMHIDEFQELGFSVAWTFPQGTSVEEIDAAV
ncbi:50S ribosome-binding protein YggL, partial [Mixta calida]